MAENTKIGFVTRIIFALVDITLYISIFSLLSYVFTGEIDNLPNSVNWIPAFVYVLVFHCYLNQTPGMILMGYKFINTDLTKPAEWKMFLRLIVASFFSITLIPAFIAVLTYDKESGFFWDRWFKVKIIKVNKSIVTIGYNQEFGNSRGGVFSIKEIIFNKTPVLHVTHDIDGDWQFLGSEDATETEVAFVHVAHLVEVDPTLLEVRDLPLGWHAWRESVGEVWKREKMSDYEYSNEEWNKKITKELLERFPEFANSEERKEVYDEDGAYIYFSYFGDFLLTKMDESEDSDFVKKTFDYINEIYENPLLTTNLWDLFGIELFERFEMEEKYRRIAEKYLTGKALNAFHGQGIRPVLEDE